MAGPSAAIGKNMKSHGSAAVGRIAPADLVRRGRASDVMRGQGPGIHAFLGCGVKDVMAGRSEAIKSKNSKKEFMGATRSVG